MGLELNRPNIGRACQCCFGGGAFVLLIGLFSSMVYHGEWDNHNRWYNRQFGLQQEVHELSVAVAVLAAFATLFLVLAVIVKVIVPKFGTIELLLWAVCFLLTIAVVMMEAACVNYTRFGDTKVPDIFNYYDSNTDFQNYVDTHTGELWVTYGAIDSPTGLPPWSVLQGLFSPSNRSLPSTVAQALPALSMEYFREMDGVWVSRRVTLCAIDWRAMFEAGKMDSGDPCSFNIKDTDANGCLGRWTASAVKDYWCELSDRNKKDAEETGLTQDGREKRAALRERTVDTIESLDSFYENNALLVGIEIVGFLVASIGLVAMNLTQGYVDAEPEAAETKPNAAKEAKESSGESDEVVKVPPPQPVPQPAPAAAPATKPAAPAPEPAPAPTPVGSGAPLLKVNKRAVKGSSDSESDQPPKKPAKKAESDSESGSSYSTESSS
jgi:hypothetical protein